MRARTQNVHSEHRGRSRGAWPAGRDLLPLYQRWINDLGTMRTWDSRRSPLTSEKEQEWYDRQSKAEDDVPFTMKETLRPIGNTGLHGVDHRNRSATFGIHRRAVPGQGLRHETTRLMLDYAFTALGLHNVMLTVFEFNQRVSGHIKGGFQGDRTPARPHDGRQAVGRGHMDCLSSEFEIYVLKRIYAPDYDNWTLRPALLSSRQRAAEP